MEELKKIPGETVESALKELCKKTGMDDKMFDAFENPEDCFNYLVEFYKPEYIVKYVSDKYKTTKASLSNNHSKRRRSKKRSKKKRSKKKSSKKRRTRKY